MSYVPIDCNFHDELEAAAVKRLSSLIVYQSKIGGHDAVRGVIVDVYPKNKAEFLLLDNGMEIRLDKIAQLNDVVAPRPEKNSILSCR